MNLEHLIISMLTMIGLGISLAVYIIASNTISMMIFVLIFLLVGVFILYKGLESSHNKYREKFSTHK